MRVLFELGLFIIVVMGMIFAYKRFFMSDGPLIDIKKETVIVITDKKPENVEELKTNTSIKKEETGGGN